ncbi:J domain-containing protein [Beggiatoa leptomitoformis]|uniref:DnaJ domain-containing protein n=1 Tax=Beggiatoa leptomitoformis TaxID=288004 RepID=A0A2N9YHV4_9GAMM|nr:DnaJ domain-containing protein [Beggiatoa leptomitoformis]ALG67719.1 DnaJ domain-containing protein [Beggiatoa leptomitoformis]AUI70043.1 DnaJ domain-containing protein [Beggiatoa leptomitoformis]
MALRDYYQILEITPDADQEEVKRAYRRLAQKYHPDRSTEANAKQHFLAVQEAYDTLKDPEQRIEYNRSRKVIRPYSFAWFRSQLNAWRRARANDYALKSAQQRAYAQEDSDTIEPTELIVGIVLFLLGLVCGIWLHSLFSTESSSASVTSITVPSPPSDNKNIATQQALNYQVAIFFIEHASPPDMLGTLEQLNGTLQTDVFNDANVKTALLSYYDKHPATTHEQALQILTKLQVKYPQDKLITERLQRVATVAIEPEKPSQHSISAIPESAASLDEKTTTTPLPLTVTDDLLPEDSSSLTVSLNIFPTKEPATPSPAVESTSLLPSSPSQTTGVDIAQRLSVCRTRINEQRLTYGEDSALLCYREILRIDPNNPAAQAGIANLKNSFLSRFDTVLNEQRVDKAKSYIRSLERIDSRLPVLKELRLKVIELENKIRAAPLLFSTTANRCTELFYKLSVNGSGTLSPEEDSYFKKNC